MLENMPIVPKVNDHIAGRRIVRRLRNSQYYGQVGNATMAICALFSTKNGMSTGSVDILAAKCAVPRVLTNKYIEHLGGDYEAQRLIHN